MDLGGRDGHRAVGADDALGVATDLAVGQELQENDLHELHEGGSVAEVLRSVDETVSPREVGVDFGDGLVPQGHHGGARDLLLCRETVWTEQEFQLAVLHARRLEVDEVELEDRLCTIPPVDLGRHPIGEHVVADRVVVGPAVQFQAVAGTLAGPFGEVLADGLGIKDPAHLTVVLDGIVGSVLGLAPPLADGQLLQRCLRGNLRVPEPHVLQQTRDEELLNRGLVIEVIKRAEQVSDDLLLNHTVIV